MRYIFLLLMICFVASCSNSASKYLGYWLKIDNNTSMYTRYGRPIIAKIEVNDNVYFFKENINSNANPITLESKGSELSASNGFATFSFHLIDSGSTLVVANQKYKRISLAETQTIKKNYDDCEKLNDTFLSDVKPYRKIYSKTAQDDNEKINEITNKYKELAKKVQNCQIIPLGSFY